MGALLLGGGLAALEYAARYRPDLLPEELQQTDPLLGWKPSETSFLVPAETLSPTGTAANGKQTTAWVDEYGFRIAPGQPTEPAAVRFVCLGNERVFAPSVPVDQTFIGKWNADGGTTRTGSKGPVVNGGMPFGCPLLWLMQLERRETFLGNHWICVIDETIPKADIAIRRGARFDPAGQPVSSAHPLAAAEKKAEPTNKPPFIDICLIRRGVPFICGLLLGDFPDERVNSPTVEAEFDRDGAFRSLEPLVRLRDQLESRGGTLTVVYLPLKAVASGGADPTNGDFPQLLNQFTAAHQIRLLDLSRAIASEDSTAPFTDSSGRLTIEGHTQVAAHLRRYFEPPLAGGFSPVGQAQEHVPRR